MELPDHLSREDVEQYAREAETLFDFCRAARVSRDRARRILNAFELKDEVEIAGRLRS
ncbi:hypothetical protein [Halosimplex marinum]|uniref:hypothetical protein n=1 Tax=Halosimplex marinum TaxID=3396620 RepID=UPI003F55F0C2